MNYNDFLTRQQQIKKLSIAEQKNFYEQLLKKKNGKHYILSRNVLPHLSG